MEGKITISKKQALIAGIIFVVIGYTSAYFSKPERVEVKEKIVTVEVEKKDTQKDIKTVKIKVTKPDGTIIEKEQSEDKTKISEEKNKVLLSDKSTNTINRSIGVRARLEADTNFKDFQRYRLSIDSPPVINIFKYQMGISGGAFTEPGNGSVGGSIGIYIQF